MRYTVPREIKFPWICRRYSQVLKPAGDTRLPTLTSALWHIRFLPITTPLRATGLGQPADFAWSGLTSSIPQEVIMRKRNLEENQKKIISWHSSLSCYQCILHFTSSSTQLLAHSAPLMEISVVEWQQTHPGLFDPLGCIISIYLLSA